MGKAIDERTLMIVGSAPCFPYGTVDPIEALGRLAIERSVWLHVDACVGGYLAPFVAEAGYAVPAFDFAVAGVASLSADLHKFGFCPKPASTIFYRFAERAAFQPFDVDEWPVAVSRRRRSWERARAAPSPAPGRRFTQWAGKATSTRPATS